MNNEEISIYKEMINDLFYLALLESLILWVVLIGAMSSLIPIIGDFTIIISVITSLSVGIIFLVNNFFPFLPVYSLYSAFNLMLVFFTLVTIITFIIKKYHNW